MGKTKWLIIFSVKTMIISNVFSAPSFKFTLAAVAMLGLSACVPPEQISVTQDQIVDAAENLEEGVTTRLNATTEAIAESVNAVKESLTGDDENEPLAEAETADDTIVEASVAIEEDEIAPPSLDPKTFLGQSRRDLITALGAEDYYRVDQGVEMLQFRMTSCIIDFVLDDQNIVTSYHSRHRQSGENYDDVRCRLDLAARRDGLQ